MWSDPIVEEVRKVRDAHAAKFNYDLESIFKAFKEEEAKSGYEFVKLPPKRFKTKEAQIDEA